MQYQSSAKDSDRGRVRQQDSPIKKNQRIIGKIELSYFEPCDIGLKPLFANENFCVFDKPHDLLIHPKGRYYHYSLNDALKYHFGHQANAIHRLDKETSGLVLCAINPQSEVLLKNLMMQHQIHKTYLAKVEGKLTQDLLIDEPIITQKHLGVICALKAQLTPKASPHKHKSSPLNTIRILIQALCELFLLRGAHIKSAYIFHISDTES